jgi:hypothetical protein
MKLLQRLLIGGMLLSGMLGFGDSFMNDWAKSEHPERDNTITTASYGYSINTPGYYNGVIDGTDAIAYKSSNGTLSFLCNTRTNNPAFCSDDGKIVPVLFYAYLDSNYFNIISTSIPYEQFERKLSGEKRMFFRSHTTNDGERKIIILKRENGNIGLYSLKIEDDRENGKQQTANMEPLLANIQCQGNDNISFFDTIDFRSLAKNKENFKKYDALQSSYAVIGCNGQIFLIYLKDGTITSSIRLVGRGNSIGVRGGMLAIDKDGDFTYYVSGTNAMGGGEPRGTIWQVGLKLQDRLVFNGHNISYDKELGYRASNGTPDSDPLFKIETKEKNGENIIYFTIRGIHRHYSDSGVEIGRMAEVTEKDPKDIPFETNYNDQSRMNIAKKFAQENGFNIDLIIYGAPYMFAGSKYKIGFPKIEQGVSESETTWNSWSKGGSVSVEAGACAEVKAGVVEGSASMGIYASIAHNNSKKFTDTTTITTSMTDTFKNLEGDNDWSVGSVHFTSSVSQYTGYGYIGALNNKTQNLTLKGLEEEYCPFSMIVPYIAIRPTSNSNISYNYHANKTNKRIDTWSTIADEAKTVGMLTAGIANYTIENGSRLISTDGGDTETSKKINDIVIWQKQQLGLDSFFDAGNDNERIQKETGMEKHIDYTGVVKSAGSQNISGSKMWGLTYSLQGQNTINIVQTHTQSMQKETDFALGFHHKCQVTVVGVGGYSEIKAGINGSYSSGKEGSKSKFFTLVTNGGSKSGSAGLAVADVNVGLFKAWLRTNNKPLKRPGWISEYAWENNSRFTAVIPFLWNKAIYAKR